MKVFLSSVVFVLLLFTPLLLADQIGEISASALAVREGPSTSYKSVAYVSKGTKVTILGKQGDWFKIKYNNTLGWASGKYINIKAETPPATGASAPSGGIVTSPVLNLRSGPSTSNEKISTLKKGNQVKILEQKDGWFRIESGGVTGWVSGKYVQPVGSSGGGTSSEFTLPSGGKASLLGYFKTTFYWMAHEKDYPGPKEKALYDTNGKLIGHFSRSFVKKLYLEGTGKLNDGRVINYIGRSRFKIIDAPYGIGSRNNPLQPYRSLAVDPKKIPIGTKIYIPEAKGMRLPDGTIHDGIFYAHDVGSGIDGNHIDVFTGVGDNREVFERMGIKNFKFIRIYKIEKSSIIERVNGI